MDDYTRSLLLNELENLTTPMDIPPQRRKDFRWLMRNAGINNGNHTNLPKVLKICKLLAE